MLASGVINALSSEISQQVVRAITGRMFTKEQIDTIVHNSIGKHFAEYFPTPGEEREAIERVAEAESHIVKATAIVAKLQADLNSRSVALRALLTDIDEKQKLAEHYATLATANEKQSAAIRLELEKAIRQELVAQANKGKRLRQAASFIVWSVTLVAGAALGAYFPIVVGFIGSLLH
ncbi:MAG: hypothetical protein JO328_11195 [Hyphomicrobiales bacterium]|nr:hypothetical protein [Hyphomicrobiales bacterium]MBV8826256.1 hypothetical protein [Hyphomicrobiales bacterium]